MCVKDCFRCHLRENLQEYAYPVETFGDGNVLFINAQASQTDSLADRPIDLHFKLVNKIMYKIGIPFRYSYVLRCPGKSYAKDIKTCVEWIKKEIENDPPKLIFTLGLVPTKALLQPKEQITDLVGKTLFFSAIPCVPLYGTGYILNRGVAELNQMTSIVESACALYL